MSCLEERSKLCRGQRVGTHVKVDPRGHTVREEIYDHGVLVDLYGEERGKWRRLHLDGSPRR